MRPLFLCLLVCACPPAKEDTGVHSDSPRDSVDSAETGAETSGPDTDIPDTTTVPCTRYTDADGDGFGDPGSPVSSPCDELPPGTVENDSDCDDTDDAVHPSAAEAPADGVDQDCDGQETCYADNDADGYGCAPLSSADLSCTDPGLSTRNDDCDDANADVHPAAVEVCGNHLDDDCAPGGCPMEAVTNLSDAKARYDGETAGERPGASASDAGDVNADGFADLLVGAPDAGAAFLVYGSASPEGRSLTAADVTYTGETPGDAAGTVSGAGDIDGDGFADLLVGAIYASAAGRDAGAVYLVRGGPSSSTPLGLGSADARFTGESAYDYAGSSVSDVGDVDGDGLDEFLVGSRANDAGGTNAGAAYLVSGTTGGSLSSAIRFTGGEAKDAAGGAVSGAGDTDGDGLADLLIGGEARDESSGLAWLVLGSLAPPSVSLADADATFAGAASEQAGCSVSGAGDVNGDGLADLLVGALSNDDAGADAGVAYLVLGRATPADLSLSSADARFPGAPGQEAGASVSGAGDVNADGHADLLIGIRDDDTVGGDAGGACLVLGTETPASVELADADRCLLGESDGDLAGYAVSGAGDVNADGWADLLVGAPYAASSAGAGYLVLGQGE